MLSVGTVRGEQMGMGRYRSGASMIRAAGKGPGQEVDTTPWSDSTAEQGEVRGGQNQL